MIAPDYLDGAWAQSGLQELTKRVNRGEVRPLIFSTFSFTIAQIIQAFEMLRQGKNIGRYVVTVGDRICPRVTRVTLSGSHSDKVQCLKSFEADTTLIILRDFMGDVTADLMSLLSNPPIPLVVVCFGHISAAAFSLLNIGTVVLAHTSTTFTLSCSPLIPTSRTRTHALLPNKCIGAAEALKMGIVDFVGTTDKMDVELQHVLKNLVLASSVRKTYGSTTYFLPTSAEAMVLSEGLARMPAQGRAGEEKQLVTLDICRESGVVTVQLNDAKHFNTQAGGND